MIDDMVPFDSDRDTSSADSHSSSDSYQDAQDRDAGDGGSDGASDGGSKDDAPFGFGTGVKGEGGGAASAGAATSRPPRKKRPARKRSPRRTSAGDDAERGPSSAAGAGEPEGASGEDGGQGKARQGETKTKRTRRKKASTAGSTAGEVARSDGARAAASAGEEAEREEGADAAGSRRKAKTRRGSRRKKPAASADSGPREAESEAGGTAVAESGSGQSGTDGESGEEDGARKRRRRGSRGGRRRKSGGQAAAIDAIPGEDDELPSASEGEGSGGDAKDEKDGKGRKRKRSGSKKSGSRRKATARTKDEKEESGSKKKRKRRKKSESEDVDPVEAKEVERDEIILINAVDPEEKRVAVVADGRIVDFMMNSDSQQTLVNDIYRGKVVNLEPAIGAAFIDFGQGRNGFLHTSDVLEMYGDKDFKLEKLLTTPVDHEIDADSELAVDDDDDDEGDEKKKGGKSGKKRGRSQQRSQRHARRRLPITDLIRVGDQVVVQITKDAIGDKGPTLTTYISIPGRYLVLMPSMARTGVSRKIPDDKERRRLKRILSSLKAPDDMGVIVRTAGVGKTKSELQRDLDYLLGVWEHFGKRLRTGRGPAPLYQESDVATRTLRDLFNTRTSSVECDDPMVYDSLLEFANKLMPEHTDRINKHEGDRPIFHHHGIEQDFEKIFARRVELPSGGSIVFDQTEALVAIDVNSGRTRTDSYDFEEVALKTNLEAVPEIARQIRLRDLGGILVCDFIDMMKSSSNRSVERALRQELSTDRARSKLGRISQFGLLELTRQRLGPGTYKKVFQTCPRCRGTGHVRTVESRAQGILRRLGSALTQKGFTSVEVRGHPEVIDYLDDRLYDYIRALEHRFDKKLTLVGVPEQAEDSVLRYLRADGREVRPGGRRKR